MCKLCCRESYVREVNYDTAADEDLRSEPAG